MFAIRRTINSQTLYRASRTFSAEAGEKVTVNKGELIERIRNKVSTEKSPLSKIRCEEIINALLEEVNHAVMVEGKEVRLTKFGTFKQKNIASMKRRNLQTNEFFTSPSVTKLAFKASPANNKVEN